MIRRCRSATLLFVPFLASLPAAQQARPVAPLAPALGTCFGGNGGPNGDFDWVVHRGELFFFDTTSTPITGGPGGVPTSTQLAQNGVVDLRNLIVEDGGEIRVQGPNPMRILATGEVRIEGRIDLSGFSAKDVATLNTGNQVELGGVGVAGGGRGGTANPITNNSSPRGGTGGGPFGGIGTGGEGGESGYSPAVSKNSRRPGGGGGGRFARDLPPSPPGLESSVLGTAASSGNPGNASSTGAVSGTQPAQGGGAGPGAFSDPKPENDFWGVRPLRGPGGQVLSLMRGELPGLWAGYGGGGGGNAMHASTFPTPNWNFSSDEKGGGGGGGAGALQVQALGPIVFGAFGVIAANGARGGTGENTNFLDHVGGTGGAGSGGHIVLESATRVDFTNGGTNTGALPRAWLQALGPVKKTGPLVDVDVCCKQDSNGGAGGAGVIQLHVPDPLSVPGTDPLSTDIVVPDAVAFLRHPLDYVASPRPFQLFPSCDPFPRTSLGWFGGAGRRILQRLDLPGGLPEDEPAVDPLAFGLEIPRW